MRKRKRRILLVPFIAFALIALGVSVWILLIAPDHYSTPIVLRGTIVTPDEIIAPGWVVVENGRIQTISSQRPNVPGAIEIDTEGIISPGLIDLHNHVIWNVIPRWEPDELFLNRYEWRFGNEDYQKIRTSFGDLRSDYFCDMNTYGEVRALVGGTTSILATENKLCIRGLVRNLDFYSGFYTLPIIQDYAHIRNYIDLPIETDRIQQFLRDDKSEAFFIHLAEGRGPAMRAEFNQLDEKGLLTKKTVIIHGIALDSDQFKRMSEQGASLIWSPRCNLELYGQTADILSALDAGVTVALAPDWAITGSSSILDELHVAAEWNSLYLDRRLSDQQLVGMVTKTPAVIAGISEEVGTISEGKYADLLVLSGDTLQPYRSLVEADPGDVRLVLINGVPVYGDRGLMKLFWAPSEFTEMEIMGKTKALTLPDFPALVTRLEQALSSHELELAPIVETVEMRIPKTISRDEIEINPQTPLDEIDWEDASFYFGENRTVCGPVVDSYYAESNDNRPTYLNIGEPYPDIDRFDVLILGDARDRFPGNPEDYYLGKTVCVSGTIEVYRGVAQIVVNDPDQIETK